MRERFKCEGCGLILEGKRKPNGEIVAYDKSGSDPNIPPASILCDNCVEMIQEGIESEIERMKNSGGQND